MYFMDEKNSTNIDKEFGDSPKTAKKIPTKTIIIIILVIVGLVIGVLFINSISNRKINLVLNGSTDIILYQDSEYIEYGYQAYDSKGRDLTDEVVVDNQVNTSITGEYEVTYSLEKIVQKRTVTIIPKSNQLTYLILKGSTTIYLKVGDTYQEEGYEVLDTENYMAKDHVTVTGTVDTKKAGTYKLVYSFKRNDGATISAERTVIVTDTNIALSYTPTKLTNGNVQININIIDNYFDYVILPNGNKEYNRNTSYSVNENGNYKFDVYSKDGTKHTQDITINNIDRKAPVISSCTGKINENKTTYTVVTSDTDIEKYVYNNQYTSTSKSYTINANVPNASLTVYDRAGNTTNTTCKSTVIYNYDKPIMPSGGETIVKQVDSETLKFWIEKRTRPNRPYYHVAHVWARDPYNQLKSGVPNNFGQQLLRPSDILTQKVAKLGLQNKYIVAINGSGFVKNGVYDTELVRINAGYDKTSVSPIVISEGKLLRNYANQKTRPYITYGLKKNGWLDAYQYGDNIQQNAATAQKVIDDGVKNTWAFSPILVYDGKIKTEVRQRNIRNGICQIDKNNFILITDVYKTGRQGFTFVEMAEYMISLGCKYGFNLDGGGSVAMMYKDRNAASPTVLSGNGRDIADILYFHE